MSRTIRNGDQETKDPADESVLHFDFDEDNLDPGVEIVPTATVVCAGLSGDVTTTPLTIDQVAHLPGNRKVQFRMKAGARGSKWSVTCKIVTNESPAQTKERSIFVLVQDK